MQIQSFFLEDWHLYEIVIIICIFNRLLSQKVKTKYKHVLYIKRHFLTPFWKDVIIVFLFYLTLRDDRATELIFT